MSSTNTNLKNLRPPFKSGKEAREMGRKGGLGKKGTSLKKSLAMRMRHLRKQGMTAKLETVFLQFMDNPDVSSLDILIHIRKLLRDNMTPEEIERYIKVMSEWHKLRHGVKKETPDVQVNIQQNFLTPEVCETKIKEILGK